MAHQGKAVVLEKDSVANDLVVVVAPVEGGQNAGRTECRLVVVVQVVVVQVAAGAVVAEATSVST